MSSGPHEEAVEASFAHVFGNADDGEEERVMQLVARHPERVEKEHLAKVPPVHRGELSHGDVERPQRDAVINDREHEPHYEVRAILEQREEIDSPILQVGAEHRYESVSVPLQPLPVRDAVSPRPHGRRACAGWRATPSTSSRPTERTTARCVTAKAPRC